VNETRSTSKSLAKGWRMRKKTRVFIGHFIAHIVLIMGSIVFFFPFFWLLTSSLKLERQMFLYPPKLIPNPIVWNNYVRMVTYLPFFSFLRNTVYVTVLCVIGSVLSSSLVAYPFARLRWSGRNVLFIVLLSTMMLPPQVTLIPQYLIFKYLGWLDTLKPLWVWSFFGVPFYIFLLRQFYMTIPYELEDAAKIDGCSYFGIYWRILLPLIKPALATVAIFSFMGAWNNFIGPLVYINSVNKMTLALGLNLFRNQFGGEWALLMAAATSMTLPVVILFFFCQRYFIQGITLTGLKG